MEQKIKAAWKQAGLEPPVTPEEVTERAFFAASPSELAL
jgi:hypothetical protein